MIRYKCRKCEKEVNAEIFENSNYCQDCGTFLQKVYVQDFAGKNFPKHIKLKPEDVHVDALWSDYLELSIPLFGSNNVQPIQWTNMRKLFYKEYREKFSPNNLLNADLVKVNFHNWLLFSNNSSWTTYQRKGNGALEQPEKLRLLLLNLQNEDIEVADRVRMGLSRPNKVKGIGQSILTSLLHTFNDNKYGVWNSKTSETLKKLHRPLKTSRDIGESYADVNHMLIELTKELDTELTMLDGFMWYVSEYVDFLP
jgi:DNA-directed RNA polymerase subunit RPC12/RpoP